MSSTAINLDIPFATNVKDSFGAKGDGTTDDTDAIQDAVDAVIAGDRPRTIYLPDGEYLSDPINVEGIGTAGLAEEGEEGRITICGSPGAVLKLKAGDPDEKRSIFNIHDCCLGRFKIENLRFEGNVAATGTIPKESAIRIYNSKGGGDRGRRFVLRDCHFRNLQNVLVCRNPDEGSVSIFNDILWNSSIYDCDGANIRGHDFVFTWPLDLSLRNWVCDNVFEEEPGGDHTDDGKAYSVVSLNAGSVLMENFAVSGKGHGYAANGTKMFVYGSNWENGGPTGFRILDSYARIAYSKFFPTLPSAVTNVWGGVDAMAVYANSASQVTLEGNVYRGDPETDWKNDCALHSDGTQNIFIDVDGRGTPQASFDAFAGSRVFFKTGAERRPVGQFPDLDFKTIGNILLGNFHEVWGTRLARIGTSDLAILATDGQSYSRVRCSGVCVSNSASATTPGTVVKKMEIFDENGTSLGFVPIYGAIT